MVPMVNAFCVEQGFNLVLQKLRNLKDALDHRFLGSCTNKIRIGPPTEQEINCINDDGLPSTGFSGDDIESLVEMDFETLNDGEVVNSYFTQHKLFPVAQA